MLCYKEIKYSYTLVEYLISLLLSIPTSAGKVKVKVG